jgi:two-component system OmpR family response regulator
MSAGSLQVLIVDDNEMASELLSEFVELLGYTAKTSATGADAVALCGNYRPQVVITDIILPDFDGYELATRLRTLLGHETRIIALSGLPKNPQRPDAGNFDYWLEKPVDLSTLENLLAQAGGKAT